MQTISFSEQPFDTFDPVYLCKVNTITFSGQIVSDSAQPGSPVIASDPTYSGPVSWTFSKPVTHVAFDVGFFDETGSAWIKFFDADGNLLSAEKNTGTGIQHIKFKSDSLIAQVKIQDADKHDPSGFSVDNVSFSNAPPQVQLSGDRDVDGILWGYKWDHKSLTYSFPTSSSEYLTNGYKEIDGFAGLTAQQISAYHKIIANYDHVCGLSFTETASPNADLRFSEAQKVDYSDGDGLHIPGGGNGTAEALAPDPSHATVSWGDVWFSHDENPPGNNNSDPELGNFIYSAAFMHELGHALGLKHGHAEQGAHGVTFPKLPYDHDTQEYSVMTYNTYQGHQGNTDQYPETLMQDDIAALQYIYGADYTSNAGDTIYSWDPTTGEEFINGHGQGAPLLDKIFMTVWDGGGNNTYDLSNYTTSVKINLGPGKWTTTSAAQLANLGGGHFARGNIANALLYQNNPNSLIDDAKGGTANDKIDGNSSHNYLSGGDGTDTILGFNGNDKIAGGLQADTLDGGGGRDTFFYGQVAASTGTACDLIDNFNARDDKFSIASGVSGVNTEIKHGALSVGNFNDHLAAIADSSHLALGHAVLVTPDAGGFKGVTFLVVDANGEAGYQANADIVILLDHPMNLESFGVANFS